jgi:hypothetical protein
MTTLKEMDFVERRNTAAAAKKQLVERMQQAPKHNDPAVIAKRAERADAKATNARQRTERDRLKREAEIQQKSQDDARAIELANAAKAEAEGAAKRSATEKAEQKAERDRRYAARKTRKR